MPDIATLTREVLGIVAATAGAKEYDDSFAKEGAIISDMLDGKQITQHVLEFPLGAVPAEIERSAMEFANRVATLSKTVKLWLPNGPDINGVSYETSAAIKDGIFMRGLIHDDKARFDVAGVV